MKIYSAEYNPCVHESEFGLLSLHKTNELAQTACNKRMSEETKFYEEELDNRKFPAWINTRVREWDV